MERLSAQTYLAAGLIVLLTVLAYLPAMQAGFIWDDNELVTENAAIPAGERLHYFWLTTEPPDYLPLTSTMLWIEWRLFGMNATGYHVINVLLHALSGVLIWRVLRRLHLPGAYIVAAIFAVHPVTVASAAWIAERKNTLSMVLFAFSMLAYLQFEENGHRRLYVAALLAFLLALLAKTSVVMMPVVLLLLAWWRRGRVNRTDLLRMSPFFVLSLALGLVTVYFQGLHGSEIGGYVRTEGFLTRLAASGWCVWFYLYKTLLPIRLAMLYPLWTVDPQWLPAWGPLLGLIVVVLVAAKWHRSAWARAILAMMGYYVAMLFPVLGFFNVSFHYHYSLVADHFQYVALIGPIALTVVACRALLQWLQMGDQAAKVGAVFVIAVLSTLTWRQALVYQSQETVWRDTVRKYPGIWQAHNSLGDIEFGLGHVDKAISHFEQALRIKPDQAEIHNNLGNALFAKGDFGEGISHLHQALRLKPNYANAHVNLGNVLLQLNQPNEAIGHYRRALEFKPNHVEAHTNMGSAFQRQGKLDEAMRHYDQALQIKPDHALTHCNLGNALWIQHKYDEAIGHYRQALEGNPNYAEAHAALGAVLAGIGRLDEAIIHFREAVRVKPDYPPFLKNLARSLATHPGSSILQQDEAIGLAERAAMLTQRKDASALDTLAVAYAASGQFERAVATAQEALRLASAAQAGAIADGIRKRLELYRQAKPYR